MNNEASFALLGIVIGGFFSWLFTFLYSKKSSKEFSELKKLVQHAVGKGRLDPCQLIGIGQWDGKTSYYDVWTTKNFGNSSLKDIEITVILYDKNSNEIDRGIGIISEIQPGNIGKVRVTLVNKMGNACDHSKISITNCHFEK